MRYISMQHMLGNGSDDGDEGSRHKDPFQGAMPRHDIQADAFIRVRGPASIGKYALGALHWHGRLCFAGPAPGLCWGFFLGVAPGWGLGLA